MFVPFFSLSYYFIGIPFHSLSFSLYNSLYLFSSLLFSSKINSSPLIHYVGRNCSSVAASLRNNPWQPQNHQHISHHYRPSLYPLRRPRDEAVTRQDRWHPGRPDDPGAWQPRECATTMDCPRSVPNAFLLLPIRRVLLWASALGAETPKIGVQWRLWIEKRVSFGGDAGADQGRATSEDRSEWQVWQPMRAMLGGESADETKHWGGRCGSCDDLFVHSSEPFKEGLGLFRFGWWKIEYFPNLVTVSDSSECRGRMSWDFRCGRSKRRKYRRKGCMILVIFRIWQNLTFLLFRIISYFLEYRKRYDFCSALFRISRFFKIFFLL